MFKKNAFITIVALLAAACAQNGGKKAETPSAEDFAPYIKAFTGGIVPEDASIRIELAEDAAKMPTEGLFTTSPKTTGTVLWTGPASVSYTPDKLEPGRSYNVKFALGKVADKAPEAFEFSITVKGKTAESQEPEEEADNGEPFRITKAVKEVDCIKIVLNNVPVNAKVKGMVELDGAARSYVQVQDSTITVHFEGAQEELELTVDQNLKDAAGNKLGQPFKRSFSAGEEKPAVEIPLKGNILPDRQALVLPFRAVKDI